MEIKILGSGCANCKTLEVRTHEALLQLNLEAQVTKVTDFAEIMQYGIMRTPGLVINKNVIVSGRVPSVDEIKEFIKQNKG